jgi:N-methylhydantoinase A
VELVSFRVRARLPERLLKLPELGAGAGSAADALKGERPAWSWDSGGWVPFPVYDRYALPAGAELAGPAIVEERESTVVVGGAARIRVDDHGFLWVEMAEVGR